MAETFTIPSMFERYSRGVPLNEELAALRDGAGQQPTQAAPGRTRLDLVEDVERELERSERLALKEMVMSPGWTVLRRLLEKSFHRQKKGAISVSQDDPLGNAQKIAEVWAYVKALDRVKHEIPVMVQAEIDEMDGVKQ